MLSLYAHVCRTNKPVMSDKPGSCDLSYQIMIKDFSSRSALILLNWVDDKPQGVYFLALNQSTP